MLLYNITQVTFRQRITPPRLLGRMNASSASCVWGVMPIAALLSGALGTWLGVVPTMWIGAIGQLLSVLFVVIGPVLGDARPARCAGGRTGDARARRDTRRTDRATPRRAVPFAAYREA